MGKGFWANIVWVSGGVLLGQLVGVLGYLFLTWLYAPAAFGAYASWVALCAIGSVISTGSLETSLVRDGDGEPRRESTIRVLLVTLIGAVIIALGCGVGFRFVPVRLGDMSNILLALAIGLAVFGMAVSMVFQSWAAAEGLFAPLTAMRVVQSTLIVAVPLALALTGRSAEQLIWGHTLGLVASVALWCSVFKLRNADLRHVPFDPQYFKDRRRCFSYVLPGLVLGVVSANLPQLAVNWRFGSQAAGYLALALRVLGMPLTLVGVAVRDVFKRHAGVAYRERGECLREFWSTFVILSLVAACFAAVMMAIGEELFVLAFGEIWRESGRMSRWLLPMFVVGVVASPLSYLVYIVGREDFDFYWQFGMLAIVAVVVLSASGVESMLKLIGLSYAGMYVIYLYSCGRFARGPVRPATKS